jgi:hypothetical protein
MPYIRSRMNLYFRIPASSNQYFSTGCEHGYCYNLNSHDFSYNLFHDFQKSLKNSKHCHCNNSRINRTDGEHYQHNLMKPLLKTSTKTTFKQDGKCHWYNHVQLLRWMKWWHGTYPISQVSLSNWHWRSSWTAECQFETQWLLYDSKGYWNWGCINN